MITNSKFSVVIAASLAAFTFSSSAEVAAQGLLSSPTTIGSSGNNDSNSAIAYHNGENLYCVVWERRFSNNDIEVRAKLRSSTNGGAGGTLTLTSGSGVLNLNPTVCEIPGTDMFMVAWQRGTSAFGPFDIYARTIDAAGNLGPTFIATHDGTLVNGSAENEVNPVLARSVDNHALLVYEVPGTGIKRRVLTTAVGSTPTTIVAGPTLSDLAISPSTTNRHCMVWQGRTGGFDVLRTAPLDLGGSLAGDTFEMSTANYNFKRPSVDGDGSEFMIVFEREFTLSQSVVQSGKLSWDSAGNVTAPSAYPTMVFTSNDVRYPSVTWLGHEFLVMWSQRVGFLDYQTKARTFKNDGFGTPIDAVETVSGSRPSDTRPVAAADVGGASVSGRAMVSWSSQETTPNFLSDVRGQIYEEWGANVGTEFTAGCGNSVDLDGLGPFAIGNTDFRFRATSQVPLPFQITLFNFGFTTATFSCGCDVVLPDVIEVATMIAGAAFYSLPLPCDPALNNVSLNVQAATLFFGVNVGVCPILPELSFSEAETWTVGY